MSKSSQDKDLNAALILERDRWTEEKNALLVTLADAQRLLAERNAQLDAANAKCAQHKACADDAKADATMAKAERDAKCAEADRLQAQVTANRGLPGLR